MEIHLRTYDSHSDTAQPAGPVAIEVPDDATETDIRDVIAGRWADPSRPFTINTNDGAVGPLRINPGWRLVYTD